MERYSDVCVTYTTSGRAGSVITPTGLIRGSLVARVHVSPPSSDRYSPSRSPANTIRPPLFATTPNAWRPMGGELNPLPASRVHVAPSSADLKIAAARLAAAVAGAEADGDGLLGGTGTAPRAPAAGYSDANSTRGVSGEAMIDGQPARSLTNSTFVHVFPPSVVRNTPRSGPGARSPIAPTTTRSGSSALITIEPMKWVSRSPTFVHVAPPSVDLYTPSPRVSSPLPT